MNFKRNCFAIITLIGSALTVTSCKDPTLFVAYENIAEVLDTHEEFVSSDNSYKKFGDYKSYVAKVSETEEKEIGSTYEILTDYTGRHILNSTGDKKILVVPVQFSDFTITNLGVKPEEYISNLNKAFFGNAKNNKFVSVAEYYNKSSYGKLRISGKVCDQFYTYPKTVYEINQKKTIRDDVQDCYNKVLTWYEDTYHESLDDYRFDPEHGNDDIAIYLVYTYPTELNKENPKFFWAYTFQDKPLSWSSYSCMNTLAGYPDAHTFIHETGHLFGLMDYYPTDESDVSNSVPEPAGRIDMMDCSVGDHTALSKMWLNWARPYWVTGETDSCEITINALVDSGDLILINDKWNGTVFDEYYLVEFYSPTGLNYFDTNTGNNLAKLPTLPGVKIYHVDARLGYYDSENNKKIFNHYCDELGKAGKPAISPNKTTKNLNVVHDNSTYTEAKDDEKHLKNYLYELQLNHVGHSVAGCATNTNLFRSGDVFDDMKFNSNKLITQDYKITVLNTTFRGATIKIEKNLN